nr:hypothetical protein CFP56_79633 [Quercus suber]
MASDGGALGLIKLLPTSAPYTGAVWSVLRQNDVGVVATLISGPSNPTAFPRRRQPAWPAVLEIVIR